MDFFVCPTMLISLCPAHNMRSFVFKYLDEIETIFENSLFTLFFRGTNGLNLSQKMLSKIAIAY